LPYLIVGIIFLVSGAGYPRDLSEMEILDLYQAGEYDSLRTLVATAPDTTGTGQFLRGLFTADGEAARFYYDHSVVFYPDSPAEPFALERLWQYHYAKGDLQQAAKYFGFLASRHPDFPGAAEKPDFVTGNKIVDVNRQTNDIPPRKPQPAGNGWGVRVGTFSSKANAQRAARAVEKQGIVTIAPVKSGSRTLYTVTLGGYLSLAEAKSVARQVKSTTGMDPLITTVAK